MRHFTKLSAMLIVTLIILTSAVGCGPNSTGSNQSTNTSADKQLSAAIKEIHNAKTFDLTMDANIDMQYASSPLNATAKINMISDLSDTKNAKLMTTGIVSMKNGTNVTDVAVNQVFVDETLYCDIGGSKYRSAVTTNKAIDIMEHDNIGDLFVARNFSKVAKKQNAESSVITFRCNSESGSFIEDILDDFIQNDQLDDFDFQRATGEATLDANGHLTAMTLNIGANMEDATTSNSAVTVTLDIVVNSLGQQVTITAPEDADSYPEVDPKTLD